MTTQELLPFLVPATLGALIPFLANFVQRSTNLPQWLSSFLYMALSALAATVPTVAFDKDLKGFLVSLFLAWVVSMRTHYTTIPDKVIPPYKPKHALLDQTARSE